MASLEKYRTKRNFETTPEPAGARVRAPARDGGLFVVHKHEATRLHYDLRLEHDGVLESWAVPKGPSRRKGDKRLAVHTEDHPLEYGEFEGVIPKGEYGGGTVMLWDRGHWRQIRRDKGRIDFELEGHKLRGAWTLTRMRGRDGKGNDNWLLIKRSDRGSTAAEVSPEKVPDNRSVATGRTMTEIARGVDPPDGTAPGTPALDTGSMPGARQGRLPARPRPQLATLTDAVPEGEGWIHEIKFDGYRIMAALKPGKVQLISRNGKDWTRRFPEIAGQLEKLPAAAVLDGEVVAMEKDGTSSFRGLQEALSKGQTATLIYQVFDLVHLDGVDLSAVPLLQRKRVLDDLLERAGFVGSATVRFTEHIEGAGKQFYDNACRLGLEGIICKRADARYRQERNRQWLKVKCARHEELLIGGFTEPAGSRSGFGALLLGAYDQRGDFVYAGKVGTGFNQRQLRELTGELRRRETDDCPFLECPDKRGVHWVRPELVAEVEFTEWTRDGMLRNPSFRGLREDKDPEDIRMPQLEEAGEAKASGKRRGAGRTSRGRKNDEHQVAGITITNPDRVLYPDQGTTKMALARFYEDIESWILPQLKRRPLVLVRCPQGRAKQCFYQKHPGDAMSGDIPRINIREKEGKAPYLYVDALPHLVALVQTGTLELHVWGSRVDDLERPDMVVFDLDPGDDVPWRAVLDTAKALRDRLEDLGLDSFVRTTGGKGLHVVAPLKPKLGWDQVKAFARGVADAQAGDDPKRLTTNMSKAKREGRIFLDYLRNGRGATAIASYSTRARQGAPVAVPVRWDELNAAMVGDRYNVGNLRRRLTALSRDPWEDFEKARRPLTKAMLGAVGAGGSKHS